MRRFVVLAVLFAITLPLRAQEATPGSDCAARLARTLAILQERSPLKEEHATGIMWLRLDAEVALQAGDIETCEAKLTKVEALLGVR